MRWSFVALLTGCGVREAVEQTASGIAQGSASPDPTERGLATVACAIIVAAVIRAIFNK